MSNPLLSPNCFAKHLVIPSRFTPFRLLRIAFRSPIERQRRRNQLATNKNTLCDGRMIQEKFIQFEMLLNDFALLFLRLPWQFGTAVALELRIVGVIIINKRKSRILNKFRFLSSNERRPRNLSLM